MNFREVEGRLERKRERGGRDRVREREREREYKGILSSSLFSAILDTD